MSHAAAAAAAESLFFFSHILEYAQDEGCIKEHA